MEDARWLRLITIGLVLAAIAVGYFLLAQRFTKNNTNVSESKPEIVVTPPSPLPTPVPSVVQSDTGQIPKSAYERIAERTRNSTQTLPATGSHAVLVGLLSIAVTIVGLGLRKFPH